MLFLIKPWVQSSSIPEWWCHSCTIVYLEYIWDIKCKQTPWCISAHGKSAEGKLLLIAFRGVTSDVSKYLLQGVRWSNFCSHIYVLLIASSVNWISLYFFNDNVWIVCLSQLYLPKQYSQCCVFNVTSLRNTVQMYHCVRNYMTILVLDFKIGYTAAIQILIIHNPCILCIQRCYCTLLGRKVYSLTDFSQCLGD